MTFKDLTQKLKEFPPYVKQADDYIIDSVTKLIDKYIEILKAVDETEYINIQTTKNETINKIEEVKKTLVDSINDFLFGKFGDSFDKIYTEFFDIKNKARVKLSGERERTPTLYRLRSSESGHLYRDDEMFHIPFELRGNVKNQRYSISGYPCLYLGSSLYVCWEELERPDIDTCNMAAIESEKELLFVNLRMPTQIKTKDQLFRIPLIIASSLKVHNSKYTFKQEYIIPQILLQCVLKRNMQGGMRIKDIKSNIDGIKYTSTHYSDKQRLFRDINLFTNYVIPVKTIRKEGLCSELCKTLKISSKPTSPNILKIFNSFNQVNDATTSEKEEITTKTDITRLYDKSLFGIIEKRLVEGEKTNLKPKTENKKNFIITKAQMDALIEHEVQERIKKS